MTIESLIEEAAEIQRRAREEGRYAAAVSALIAKATLAGLWVERSQNKNANTVHVISDEPLSARTSGLQFTSPRTKVWRNFAMP